MAGGCKFVLTSLRMALFVSCTALPLTDKSKLKDATNSKLELVKDFVKEEETDGTPHNFRITPGIGMKFKVGAEVQSTFTVHNAGATAEAGGSGAKWVGPVVGGVAGGLVVIAAIVIGIVCCKKKQKKKDKSSRQRKTTERDQTAKNLGIIADGETSDNESLSTLTVKYLQSVKESQKDALYPGEIYALYKKPIETTDKPLSKVSRRRGTSDKSTPSVLVGLTKKSSPATVEKRREMRPRKRKGEEKVVQHAEVRITPSEAADLLNQRLLQLNQEHQAKKANEAAPVKEESVQGEDVTQHDVPEPNKEEQLNKVMAETDKKDSLVDDSDYLIPKNI